MTKYQKTAYTPGPWKPTFYPNNVATMEDIVYHSQGEACMSHANARLIAAAPELLEACKEALQCLNHSPECPETQEKLCEAITKATTPVQREWCENSW